MIQVKLRPTPHRPWPGRSVLSGCAAQLHQEGGAEGCAIIGVAQMQHEPACLQQSRDYNVKQQAAINTQMQQASASSTKRTCASSGLSG